MIILAISELICSYKPTLCIPMTFFVVVDTCTMQESNFTISELVSSSALMATVIHGSYRNKPIGRHQ